MSAATRAFRRKLFASNVVVGDAGGDMFSSDGSVAQGGEEGGHRPPFVPPIKEWWGETSGIISPFHPSDPEHTADR